MTDSYKEAGNASDFTRAINAVLLELADMLSEYQNSLVISGGLAMHLLFGTGANHSYIDNNLEEGSEVSGDKFFARVTKDLMQNRVFRAS